MVTNKPPTRRNPGQGAPAGPRAPLPDGPPDPFAALADPTRRAILDGLRAAATGRAGQDGGRTAGQIAGDFAISRPAVSKHLRVLAGAGLVRVVRHGRERHYHLQARPLEQVDAWVGRYRLFWAARLVHLKEYLEAEATTDRPPPTIPGGPSDAHRS